jgi:hypothetical protein
MRTNLTLAAAAALIALSFGVAQAADTAPAANQPDTGAGIGTPGAENKGNPIPVPDQASQAPVGAGQSATDTTPGEQTKGETRGKPGVPQ